MLELESQWKERANSIARGSDAQSLEEVAKDPFSFLQLVVGQGMCHGVTTWLLIVRVYVIDDCIMQTAFESHVFFVEFGGDRDETNMILLIGRKVEAKHASHL